ncbi:MAG: hypothetical protein M3R12_01125, partial [Actinomycetota bacterium]|nr:hypothetical protein [Actinomycetota bacterium]
LQCEGAVANDDVHAQIAWRVARAKASAVLGDGEAEQTAAAAVELAYDTDSPLYTADALEALSIALAAAGREGDAAAAARDALHLYESKGHRAGAERIRNGRAAVRTASPPG